MLEPVSVGLKFGFLAVLYLFLMWVAWSALRDLRRGRSGPSEQPERPQYDDATGMYPAAAGLGEPDSSRDCWWSALPGMTPGLHTTCRAALRSAAETSRSGSTTRSRHLTTPGSDVRDTC